MKTLRLGQHGPEVFPLGLGCMGMSDFYGPADEAESLATLHAAIDAGFSLLDTGDFYGMGHNELLIAEALKQHPRSSLQLSVKFGALRSPSYEFLGVDGRPAAVKNFLAMSLKRLRTDYIDIYRPARLDPQVPIEDTIGAVADMIQAGYVRYAGLSEMGPDTIRRAHSVTPIADLQIEYSLISRTPENAILPVLRELGIGMTAYGVLSRGLLAPGSQNNGPTDYRNYLPRFTGNNRQSNQQLIDALQNMAALKNTTPTRLAIAWVRAQGTDILPLVGLRKRSHLPDALGALDVSLTEADLAQLNVLFPVGAAAGSRYPEEHMGNLDSERA